VISESNEPAVLIAHSAGCITAATWSSLHAGPVRAALLVTPPHIDGLAPDDPSDLRWVVPRDTLPFRAIVVASRTDPYTTFTQFERMATDWGAELVDAGDVGHLDTAAGFGPWPAGERLVSELAYR
jgi:predicted alpha/beta hydrolase family esterase